MPRLNQERELEPGRRAIVLVTPAMPRLASGGPVGACYRLLDALSRLPDLGADLYCLCTSPVRLDRISTPDGMNVFATAESKVSGVKQFRQRLIDATAYGSIRAVRDVFHAGFALKERVRRQTLKQVISNLLESYSSSLFHAHIVVDVDRLVDAFKEAGLGRPRIILTEHSKGGMRRQYVELLGSRSVLDRAYASNETWQENAARGADVIAFPSSGARELWEQHNPTLVPLTSPKSVVMYNGVPRPTIPGQTREVPGELRMVAIAEHIQDKGIDRLIHGVARLREILPGRLLRLRIAGGSTSLTPKLVQLKSDLQLGAEVEFLGKVPHDALMQEMADAHFLVAMPRVVVFDLSILEAMALGKPVLTTELPGNIEALGAHYPLYVKDAEEFARKIAGCDGEVLDPREIGNSNFQRYEALFTSEAMASQHCRLYARLFELESERLATEVAQ